jgi:predicted transcriptional regulator
MTVKEELHRLIDELPEAQARDLLGDLRDAADADGPPLDAEALASLDRGLADIAAGRVKPLEDYERERGL